MYSGSAQGVVERVINVRYYYFYYFSSPAKPSMSSVKRRLVIVLPPMLTVPSWSSKASVMILSRYILKRVGESRHPCRTPAVVWNQSPMLLLKRTALVALSYRFLMTWEGWCRCCTSSRLPTKLHAKPCRRPSWSLWRHGRGLAGAGDISHRECVGWRSALWYSFLLWSVTVFYSITLVN